uniref:Uncharacterized protein n=1 Tax=viral metagenome TaxID=1070528 RepID=A0A6C0BCU7_9ZZZZ
METVTPGEKIKECNNGKLGYQVRGMAYQAYKVKRRTIISSPDHIESSKNHSSATPNILGNNNLLNESVSHSSNSRNKNFKMEDNPENYSKNLKYESYSPNVPEVSLPGGTVYKILDDKDGISVTNSYQKSLDKNQYTPRSYNNINKNSDNENLSQDRHSNHSSNERYRGTFGIPRNSKSTRYRQKHSKKARSPSPISEYSESSYDSDEEERIQKRKERKEAEHRRNQMMDIILQDYFDRKQKEKDESKKQDNKENTSSKINEPSFQVPKAEPAQKQKIPNYNDLSDEDKEKAKNKFIDLYQRLINSYPEWTIKLPDFENLPLRIIHERYEEVVKAICIYQTAMKWKVYLIIIIAAIEYYGYNVKGYTYLKGLLKSQIKSIHKYNGYLIEIAEQFYSDESGEDWPLWVRFLGTIASGLTSFCGINGLSKACNMEAPDFVFEQADKFVSPPEGTAKLRTDGISDLPTPPTGFQNPDTIVNVIGKIFNTFTGNGTNTSSSAPTATAQPVNQKNPDDDYTNIEF